MAESKPVTDLKHGATSGEVKRAARTLTRRTRCSRSLLPDLIPDDPADRRAAQRRKGASADHSPACRADARADGGVALTRRHAVAAGETGEEGYKHCSGADLFNVFHVDSPI